MYRTLDLEEAWELHCLGAPVERMIEDEDAPDCDWSPLSVQFALTGEETFADFQDCYDESYAAIFRVQVE